VLQVLERTLKCPSAIMPAVSVPPLAVVPTYLREQEDLDKLLRCLTSLRATAPGAILLVVDDASPSDELAGLAELATGQLDGVFVRNEVNSGFAATVNVGLGVALREGADAVLVNADIEFAWPGWLEAMQAREDTQGRPAAVVGARLLFPDGTIQHGGIYFSLLNREFFHRFRYGPAELPEALMPTRCPVTAALALIRHECLETVGLFDDGFGMAYEDVDYCLRVFASGRECIYEPAAVATHLEKSFRDRPTAQARAMADRSVAHLWAKHAGTDLSPWVPPVR
jgi:GT2 family glycosyltransferase